MTKLLRTLPYVLLLLNLAFILGNSLLDGSHSRIISTKAEKAIEQVVGKDIENDPYEVAMYGRTFNTFLRKAAHAVEFFTLGVLAYLCALPLRAGTRALVLPLFGLAVPFADESLQLLVERSAMISDMWIDIFGFAVGGILAFAACLSVTIIKKRLNK